jgi:hypothetical protein
MEQDEDNWDNTPQFKGGKGDGFKKVIKDYPSVPFVDPKTGKQWAINSTYGAGSPQKWKPLYIGAGLVMSYFKNGVKSNNFNESKYFEYQLNFFITEGPNVTWENIRTSGVAVNEYKQGGSYIWNMTGRKLSNGQFQVYGKPTPLNSTERIYAISDLNDTNKTIYMSFNYITELSNGFPSNPAGFVPTLIPKINSDLESYGYPKIPNKLTTSIQNVS